MREISAARSRFFSTSKRPPQRLHASIEIGEALGGGCGHG
jgi:hypothetical protein